MCVWVCVHLPFHTVCIFPPVFFCEPSGVSVCFAARERKAPYVHVLLTHGENRRPNKTSSHTRAHTHTYISQAAGAPLSERWLASEVNLERRTPNNKPCDTHSPKKCQFYSTLLDDIKPHERFTAAGYEYVHSDVITHSRDSINGTNLIVKKPQFYFETAANL